MAKLSAHGTQIGEVKLLTKTKRYFSDGKILINYGDGWKLFGKVKPGMDPGEVSKTAEEKQKEGLRIRPLYAKYFKLLHKSAGMNLRSKLHTAVSMMPEDPDGAWACLDDEWNCRGKWTFEDINALCLAYLDAIEEQKRMKTPATCEE